VGGNTASKLISIVSKSLKFEVDVTVIVLAFGSIPIVIPRSFDGWLNLVEKVTHLPTHKLGCCIG
jgi:hypothetical protein